MEELKPCPFCGGEAQIVSKPYEPKFCVGCDDDTCLGFSGLGWLYDSGQEAAAAWNRRAERTCRIEEECDEEETDLGTVEVLTYWCSVCFGQMSPDGNYCPNCGARVVEEE